MQWITESKAHRVVYWLMGVGLFLQLSSKVLYTSDSTNGVHVYLLLILPALLLTVWSFLKKESLFSAYWSDSGQSVLYVLRKSLVIFLYLAAIIYLVTVAKWQHIKFFIMMLCVVAAVGALVSLCYQLVVLDESFGWRTFRIYRMGHGEWIDLGYPVIAGIYFALFGVLAASLVALGHQNHSQNLVLMLVILVLLPYVFLTFSRTSWIAWAVAICYLMVVFRHRATIALATILACIAFVMIAIYQNEMAVEVTERQLSGRPQIWLWTLQHFLERPLLGHGCAACHYPSRPLLEYFLVSTGIYDRCSKSGSVGSPNQHAI